MPPRSKASPKPGSNEDAGTDQNRQSPGMERQEDQVDQAKAKTPEGGGHPRYRGGHALLVAVPQHEDRGDHRPHAAQQVIGSTIKTWDSRKLPTDFGSDRGLSYEEIISIANETKKSIWICIPALADDNHLTVAQTRG